MSVHRKHVKLEEVVKLGAYMPFYKRKERICVSKVLNYREVTRMYIGEINGRQGLCLCKLIGVLIAYLQ